jgi:hypothetical protein
MCFFWFYHKRTIYIVISYLYLRLAFIMKWPYERIRRDCAPRRTPTSSTTSWVWMCSAWCPRVHGYIISYRSTIYRVIGSKSSHQVSLRLWSRPSVLTMLLIPSLIGRTRQYNWYHVRTAGEGWWPFRRPAVRSDDQREIVVVVSWMFAVMLRGFKPWPGAPYDRRSHDLDSTRLG